MKHWQPAPKLSRMYRTRETDVNDPSCWSVEPCTRNERTASMVPNALGVKFLLGTHAYRLRSRKEEQTKLAASLEDQVQEKLASQSGEVKALSEEASVLRSELKTVVEETQVRYHHCATFLLHLAY